MIPLLSSTVINPLTPEEKASRKRFHAHFLRVCNRWQEHHIMMHGIRSKFWDKHKEMVEYWLASEEYWPKKEAYLFIYSIMVCDVLGVGDALKEIEAKNIKNAGIPNAFKKKDHTSYIDPSLSINTFYDNQLRSPDIIVDNNSNFKFENLGNYGTWDHVLQQFSSKNKVVYAIGDKVEPKFRSELIQHAIRSFPDSYILSNNRMVVKSLHDAKLVSVLKRNDLYPCTLRIDDGPVFDNIKSYPYRLCKKYYGKEKDTYLSEHGCYKNCGYYHARFAASRSLHTAMRYLTFVVQTYFSEGGAILFKPRTLIVVENMNDLVSTFRNFFSFRIPKKYDPRCDTYSTLSRIKDFLEEKILRYENKGWDTLVDGLRNLPDIVEYPNHWPHPYTKEDDITLFKILKKQGRSYYEGLKRKQLKDLHKTKDNLYRVKLALQDTSRYNVSVRDAFYVIQPRSVNYIIKEHITKYAKYFLILS